MRTERPPILRTIITSRRTLRTLARLSGGAALTWAFASVAVEGRANAGVDFAQAIVTGHFTRTATTPDLNDVAVGTPLENVGTAPENAGAGSVTVFWRTPGSTLENRAKLTREFLRANFDAVTDGPALANTTALDNHFGASLAVGDFNGDGLSDLAIGVPDYGNSRNGTTVISESGYVHILFGTSGMGNAATPFQRQTKILSNPFLRPGFGDRCSGALEQFGMSLAAGRFDIRAPDDLAVGVPGACGQDGSVPKGMVYFYRGGDLASKRDAVIENPFGQGGEEVFGETLAAGDFMHSGSVFPMQIAIGAPNGLIQAGNLQRAGFVMTYSFSAARNNSWIVPDLNTSRFYSQEFASPPGAEKNEAYDHFGFSLAAVPLDGVDGACALLVGAPSEDSGGTDTGVVHFFSPANLVPPQILRSTSFGVPRQARAFFGRSLAGGFLRPSASPRLAGVIIGEPGRDSNTGAAYFAQDSSAARGTLVGSEVWSSVSPAAGDRFGEAVAVGVSGPAEDGGGTGIVGKGYVGVPGKKVVQFNVGPTGSGKNLLNTP